jgi:formamidopyrimidine-DNA glycosylase
MPELPEVETTVRGIQKYTKGLTIKDVWTDYNSAYHAGKPHVKNAKFFPTFRKIVIGAKVTSAERRAKNILIHLSNPKSPGAIGQGKNTIIIHMKMTGHLLYGKYVLKNKVWTAAEKGPLQDPFNRFIHLVFTLSPRHTRGKQTEKHLVLSDMRKFAKVTIVPTKDLATSVDLAHIGPEPLDKKFTAKDLEKRLRTKPSGKIKTVLMDQTVVAGIGNIYSDEILWAVGIHPLSRINKLTSKNISNIWKSAREILKKGIDFKGDSMSDYRNIEGKKGKFQYEHKAYQQKGEKCFKRGCGGIIQRIVVGGRSTHFCPTHQKLLT